MNIAPTTRVRRAWSHIRTGGKIELVFAYFLLSAIHGVNEAIMNRAGVRIALLIGIVAYAAFFLAYYDQIGRGGFFAGIVLGVILTVLLIASFIPRIPPK
jgi:hypothetical protein